MTLDLGFRAQLAASFAASFAQATAPLREQGREQLAETMRAVRRAARRLVWWQAITRRGRQLHRAAVRYARALRILPAWWRVDRNAPDLGRSPPTVGVRPTPTLARLLTERQVNGPPRGHGWRARVRPQNNGDRPAPTGRPPQNHRPPT